MSLFSPDSLQEVVHGRTRLLVLAVLSHVGSIEFVALRDRLKLADGSLHKSLKKLEDVQYVKLAKGRDEAGRSKTTIEMTPAGHKALQAYLDDIRELTASIPDPRKR